VPVTERDSHTNGRLQRAAGEYYIGKMKYSYTLQQKDSSVSDQCCAKLWHLEADKVSVGLVSFVPQPSFSQGCALDLALCRIYSKGSLLISNLKFSSGVNKILQPLRLSICIAS
jgi:hypothetical protein